MLAFFFPFFSAPVDPSFKEESAENGLIVHELNVTAFAHSQKQTAHYVAYVTAQEVP